jgi:hypothetical protein
MGQTNWRVLADCAINVKCDREREMARAVKGVIDMVQLVREAWIVRICSLVLLLSPLPNLDSNP